MTQRRMISVAVGLAILTTIGGGAAQAADPTDPAYWAADAQNMADAYGRIDGPNGQLQNPAYLPALVQAATERGVEQLLDQVATPNRLAPNPGNVFPGWNVGNPLRAGWVGTRGRMKKVAFTNRYGALLRGRVWAPLPRATDPYTGERLRGPYPGVVITPGSVQGSQGMYEWLAQDLAERGYVVLTYDVQGEGTSETLPHTSGDVFPFCDPTATPDPYEMTGCPGVPFQQASNYVVGTEDALSFFLSTPEHPYPNPGDADGVADAANPFWRLFDRSPDHATVTPGRTTRIAIIGHSLGAAAVSYVQGVDPRVETVVALDKLSSGDSSVFSVPGVDAFTPVVPGLALQAEYGFSVTPWWMSGGSSINPTPSPDGPDPMRERATGFDTWAAAGVDTMLVVPRASTHLEWTDIPLVLPASRWGQDLSSVYIQNWLGHYLKHEHNAKALLAKRLHYLEPVGNGEWAPVTLQRDDLLSQRYCSAVDFHDRGRLFSNPDLVHVGC